MLRLPTILREHKQRTGISYSFLARKLMVSNNTFGLWVAGATVPQRAHAQRLAEELGRPDIVDIVEQDRTAVREIAAPRTDRSRENTPRTLIIPAEQDGAA